MKITKSDLLTVAAVPKQYPAADQIEVAFAGRSNVGKSSLINLLCGRKSLARVSGNPGKTRTINFYQINDQYRIVDLPGYGYAKVSRSMSESWGNMIETYLKARPNLAKVALLVDCRHEPSAQDKQMYEWLKYYGMDGLVVATKADKLSRNELQKNLAMIRRSLQCSKEDKIFAVSALKRTGMEALVDELGRLWGADAPAEVPAAEAKETAEAKPSAEQEA
ncbi:MAG: YihA family ribosome biogenesis GTP-binding protein [Clostridiales bacterium]|nr:YihA family ribosome biogenesis GTP-binding protein [Clostridiales bacterium]